MRAMEMAVAKQRGPHTALILRSAVLRRHKRASLHTHNGDGLDTEHEGVRRQVAGVRQGILLPQLGEEVLRACESGMAVDEVAFVLESPRPKVSVLPCRGKVGRAEADGPRVTTYPQRSSEAIHLDTHISPPALSCECAESLTLNEPAKYESVCKGESGVEPRCEPHGGDDGDAQNAAGSNE